MKKRSYALERRQKEDTYYTNDNKDAVNYFSGKRFYQTYQDPSTGPNLFDNRQTLLIKMHNREMRMKFLKNIKDSHNHEPPETFKGP